MEFFQFLVFTYVDITPHLLNKLFVIKLNDQLNDFGFGTL